jgi:hypothetical protein
MNTFSRIQLVKCTQLIPFTYSSSPHAGHIGPGALVPTSLPSGAVGCGRDGKREAGGRFTPTERSGSLLSSLSPPLLLSQLAGCGKLAPPPSSLPPFPISIFSPAAAARSVGGHLLPSQLPPPRPLLVANSSHDARPSTGGPSSVVPTMACWKAGSDGPQVNLLLPLQIHPCSSCRQRRSSSSASVLLSHHRASGDVPVLAVGTLS